MVQGEGPAPAQETANLNQNETCNYRWNGKYATNYPSNADQF